MSSRTRSWPQVQFVLTKGVHIFYTADAGYVYAALIEALAKLSEADTLRSRYGMRPGRPRAASAVNEVFFREKRNILLHYLYQKKTSHVTDAVLNAAGSQDELDPCARATKASAGVPETAAGGLDAHMYVILVRREVQLEAYTRLGSEPCCEFMRCSAEWETVTLPSAHSPWETVHMVGGWAPPARESPFGMKVANHCPCPPCLQRTPRPM
jgi:hypothetical protein